MIIRGTVIKFKHLFTSLYVVEPLTLDIFSHDYPWLSHWFWAPFLMKLTTYLDTFFVIFIRDCFYEFGGIFSNAYPWLRHCVHEIRVVWLELKSENLESVLSCLQTRCSLQEQNQKCSSWIHDNRHWCIYLDSIFFSILKM